MTQILRSSLRRRPPHLREADRRCRRCSTPSTISRTPRKFVADWQAIRDEAIAVRLEKMPRFHDIMPEQADISANDGLDWRMLILKAYGVAVPENIGKIADARPPPRRVSGGQVGDHLLPGAAQAHPPSSRPLPRRHALPSRPEDPGGGERPAGDDHDDRRPRIPHHRRRMPALGRHLPARGHEQRRRAAHRAPPRRLAAATCRSTWRFCRG